MAQTLQNAQQLAAAYGVSQESLRLYEARGLLRPVRIDGVSYYTPKDRVRLEIVLKGKRLGFSLAEIEGLISNRPLVAPPAASREAQQLDLDRLIDELRELTGRRDELDNLISALRLRRNGK